MLTIERLPESKAKYQDGRVVHEYWVRSKKPLNRDEMQKLGDQVSRVLAKTLKGKVITSLYTLRGWKAKKGGTTTVLGEPIKLWNLDDYTQAEAAEMAQDTFHELYFVVLPAAPKKGGKDPHNDCLFNTICSELNGCERLPKKFNTAEKLKAAMKIKRDDPIHINRMPDIERIFKVNVNISGDHDYDSKGKYDKTISIWLKNGHYFAPIDRERRERLCVGYFFEPKPVMTFYRNDQLCYFYDGKEIRKYSDVKFREFRQKNKFKVVLVDTIIKTENRNERPSEAMIHESIKKNSEEYIKDSEVLEKATDGLINLRKSAYNGSHARALFYEKSKNLRKPSKITPREIPWISSHASLQMSELGEYENVYEYDVNRFYNYILVTITHPMEEGDFKTIGSIEEIKEYPEFGLYRCIIYKSGERKDKFFRFIDNNIYTHYDIRGARLLKLKIEMIMDGKPNALTYTGNKSEYGSVLYKPTIDYFDSLRKQNLPRIKKINSSLWGAQCERRSNKVLVKDEGYIMPDDQEPIAAVPVGTGLQFEFNDLQKPFVCDYARCGVFVTSYGRFWMLNSILPHLDSIVRIHTDSILSLKEIPEL